MKHDRTWRSYWARIRSVAAMQAARLRGRRAYAEQARSQPAVSLYGNSLSGNLKAFFDYAHATPGLPYTVQYVTIDRAEHSRLIKRYDRDIVLAATVGGMAKALGSAFFMTSHTPGIFNLLHRYAPHVRFLDVWHGLGFKTTDPKWFKHIRPYTAVFVSSERFREIYRDDFGFDERQLVVTGYARVDRFVGGAKDVAERVRGELGVADGRRILLFAPTWRQADETTSEVPFGCSVDEFASAVNGLCERLGAVLFLRPHRHTTLFHPRRCEEMAAADQRYPHIVYLPQPAYPETNDLLLATDLLVTDWSSIACDYSVSERPTVFIDTPFPLTHPGEFDSIPRGGDIASSLPEFLEAVERGLSAAPEDVRERQAAAMEVWYGSTLDGRSAARYDRVIRALLDTDRLPEGAVEPVPEP